MWPIHLLKISNSEHMPYAYVLGWFKNRIISILVRDHINHIDLQLDRVPKVYYSNINGRKAITLVKVSSLQDVGKYMDILFSLMTEPSFVRLG